MNAPTIDRYSTWEMDAIVQSIDPEFSFLHNTFFATEVLFNSQTVEHDIVEGGQRVAPFVSPLAQGVPTRRTGFRTYAMRPGYIKLADVVRPQDGQTRLPGEPYGGTYDPQTRVDLLVAKQIRTHLSMIDNRLEIMARDALFDARITITDTTGAMDYPTATVDFERNPNNDATAGTLWTANGRTPLKDIQNHALTINQTSRGAVVDTLLMCGELFDLISSDDSFKALLSRLTNLSPGTQSAGFETGPRSGSRKAQFRGRLASQYDLWTYDGYFEDDTGAQKAIMDPDKIVFLANQGENSGMEGRRLQGAIMDMDAGIRAQKVFVKARNLWDPSGVEVLTQSAPMVSMRRPNATGTLKVR